MGEQLFPTAASYKYNRPEEYLSSGGIIRDAAHQKQVYAYPVESWGNEKIEKVYLPDNCDYKVRCVTLPNKMRVVLVSDALAKLAAASLSVNVGSYADGDVDGIAHFLEHMLFLGSEKFPGEDEYNQYLAKYGGNSNAYTASDLTNFYFSIEAAHLEGALDRFAQFFISPLFLEGASKREIQAVHSEHSKNIPSTYWRENHVLNWLVNRRNHPMGKFHTGDESTLWDKPLAKGVNIRDKLLAFHKEYYSANIMALAITGPQSLDELENLAQKYFAEVHNCDVQLKLGLEYNVTNAEELAVVRKHQRTDVKLKELPKSLLSCSEMDGKFIKVVPTVDSRHLLSFAWRSPANEHCWPAHAESYLAHILGHEHKGSLASLIQSSGLGVSVNVGADEEPQCGTQMFNVRVAMGSPPTEEQLYKIAELVFGAISQLIAAPVDPALLREMRIIDDLVFSTSTLPRQDGLVSYISQRALVRRPEVMFVYGSRDDSDAAAGVVEAAKSMFTASNMSLFLSSAVNRDECHSKEKYYQCAYAKQDIPKQWLERFDELLADGGKFAHEKGISICDRNQFIPKDLSLVETPKEKTKVEQVDLFPGATLFYKTDDFFKQPHVVIQMEVRSSKLANMAIRDVERFSVYLEAVGLSCLESFLYDAKCASFRLSQDVSLRADAKRGTMTIYASGYSDKIELVVSKAITALTEEVSESTIKTALDKKKVAVKARFQQQQSYSAAIDYIYFSLSGHGVDRMESMRHVQELEVDDIVDFQKTFVKSLWPVEVHSFICGNVDAAFATGMATRLSKQLSATPVEGLPPRCSTNKRFQLMSDEAGVELSSVGTSWKNENNATVVFFPLDNPNVREGSIATLFALWAYQPFFDDLRTSKSLGYVTTVRPASVWMESGPMFIVQSSVATPEHLQKQIDNFLTTMDLESLSEEEFFKHRDGFKATLMKPYASIEDEFTHYIQEVSTGRLDFNRRQKRIDDLDGISLDEFKSTVKLILKRQIMVKVYGLAYKNGDELLPNEEGLQSGVIKVKKQDGPPEIQKWLEDRLKFAEMTIGPVDSIASCEGYSEESSASDGSASGSKQEGAVDSELERTSALKFLESLRKIIQ